MDLYDMLACPTCKVGVVRRQQTLVCPACQRSYPIVNDVPVLLPDGSIPEIRHEHELIVRLGYDPYKHRTVMQSLPASARILDLGAGNMAVNLPNIIRMDPHLTPYVDVVGDAHTLPFLPGVFDYVLSLAVVEHLRQPFLAAQEMYAVLRPGGYVYGDCNFIFPYHGYPHHYFNATEQGLEQVFGSFVKLASGVQPTQMPSYALRAILEVYQYELGSHAANPDMSDLQTLLTDVLDHPLETYDQYLSQRGALRLAAGTFYVGVKAPAEGGSSEVIPAVIQQLWHAQPELQERFPHMLDLSTTENIMVWARQTGCQQFPELAAYFAAVEPFQKSSQIDEHWISVYNSWPVSEWPHPHKADHERERRYAEKQRTRQPDQPRVAALEAIIREKNAHIAYLEHLLRQIESGRVMRALNTLQGLFRR